ncbi:methylated-DNA--[protein]-cysteine S-methyltransferase [Nocardioides sp. ChNu-153]|uniref:methylated-DNA--[protein]-cysteine S-methyltransferase n=1 Tax=unclassified Nocardioides TaxID=2615069 RepID=UPI0024076C95|nr:MULTISPECIES: methylated-DNA--[protein]-cysteine S-methyltransferase [unclassified Nocardioides]MDF9716957.1 methylated-DNA--[protein]-cysteine S-methyltransferase [Nocardioides sp. ChNu-99]MDN7122662.1 methylated-DNA--[protein]-cysteine S-methyltransferase [Nocardioides sp. ChNu-153]
MWTVVDSPIGELRLVEHDGAVTAIEFAPFPAAVRAPRDAASPEDAPGRDDDRPVLVETAAQLAAYFAGGLTRFDLPLAPVGTPFQQKVWAALAEIPYGATTSYGAVARTLGLTGHGSRAVGLANGRNPVPVVVPCHRVVGADGSLTGYAGGVERKQALLDLEQGALF